MKKTEFIYRREWLGSAMAGVMISTAIILYLGITFGHRSHLFNGSPISEHYVECLLLVAFVALSVKFWRDTFDNRTVLLINHEGISIRRELLPWSSLAGYTIQIHENVDGEGNIETDCIFDFRNGEEKMMRFSEIEVRADELVDAIAQCSVGHNVVFRGYETITDKGLF